MIYKVIKEANLIPGDKMQTTKGTVLKKSVVLSDYSCIVRTGDDEFLLITANPLGSDEEPDHWTRLTPREMKLLVGFGAEQVS